MDSDTTDVPPNSNEAWFNQESSIILHEKVDDAKREPSNLKEPEAKNSNPIEGEAKVIDMNNPSIEDSQSVRDVDIDPIAETSKNSQIHSKNDISPDELNAGNEFLPTGCDVNSPEFNDDQDVEIINAFKQGS
jgi:hypothetical protein